jgi:hypothetical protein
MYVRTRADGGAVIARDKASHLRAHGPPINSQRLVTSPLRSTPRSVDTPLLLLSYVLFRRPPLNAAPTTLLAGRRRAAFVSLFARPAQLCPSYHPVPAPGASSSFCPDPRRSCAAYIYITYTRIRIGAGSRVYSNHRSRCSTLSVRCPRCPPVRVYANPTRLNWTLPPSPSAQSESSTLLCCAT